MNKIVIHYQTHQELKNKNSLTEMNHQLWKMETPHNQTKVNLESLKGIMNREKTTIPSLRNIKWRTVKTETNKINKVLPYISAN